MNTGRSSLASKTGILVGSGFGKSPVKPGGSINMIVYKTDDQWVICMSELDCCGDAEEQRSALGTAVAGELFAAYAVRGIGSEMDYPKVRELIEKSARQSFPGMDMQWLADEKLDASEPLLES